MKFNLEESIVILSNTPDVIEKLLSGLSNPWLITNEGDSTWSPFDIIGHLIHGEKTDWIPRAKIILNDIPNKTFTPFDRFAQFENSIGKSISELINEFKEFRKQNIQQLHSLNIDQKKLNLKGFHPDFGEVTLEQLLATWVVHDLSHINQITRVLMKNYKAEVGPWANYISILKNG